MLDDKQIIEDLKKEAILAICAGSKYIDVDGISVELLNKAIVLIECQKDEIIWLRALNADLARRLEEKINELY